MMHQSFTVTARPEQGPPRLAMLRGAMRAEGVDAFLIPRSDAHQGEYVAPRDERLAWLTGFTGSAGFAAVTADQAGVFVDGRYRVQVKAQVDLGSFTPIDWPETALQDWLLGALPEGAVVGFDAWLHAEKQREDLATALAPRGVTLRATDNLIDRIWPDQPPPPEGAITAYPLELAGEESAAKRARLAADLRERGERAAVLTLPDSIAWLLNIRGADIPRIPVAHAFAILHDDARVQLFTLPGKAGAAVRAHLGDAVSVSPPTAFAGALERLAGPVRLDRASVPVAVAARLAAHETEIVWGDDPCIAPKAAKNPTEIAGAVAAHLRDGAAMVEFLCWLDGEDPATLTEIDVVRRLEGFRRATGKLRDISFETIAGAGPNGAIVHYRVTEESNRALAPGELLLVDSGGQYADGTTDITRTIALGPPGADERAAFTRVLKGMIAISMTRWPRGLAGRDLDALARWHLWQAGQDYDHGTGHGVGAYLSVHEAPQRLSRLGHAVLEPGMILSNEPGYYREGAFGIRIENLIVVSQAPGLMGGDARNMLNFQTLTFAPIDRRLIDAAMLNAPERDWLNAYHAETADKIGPRCSEGARAWLARATAPI